MIAMTKMVKTTKTTMMTTRTTMTKMMTTRTTTLKMTRTRKIKIMSYMNSMR